MAYTCAYDSMGMRPDMMEMIVIHFYVHNEFTIYDIWGTRHEMEETANMRLETLQAEFLLLRVFSLASCCLRTL